MSLYFIKANSSEFFNIPARFIFIKSITNDLSLRIRGKSKNIEIDNDIVSGSKLSGFSEVISEWEIINNNNIDINIDIQNGTVFYDENRTSGDINSLTRFSNLTKDGNQFFGGKTTTAIVSNFSWAGIENPINSGVTVYITDIAVSSTSGKLFLSKDNNSSFSYSSLSRSNKKLYGNDPKAQITSDNSSQSIWPKNGIVTDLIGVIPVDIGGNPYVIKLDNSPIELNEGEGIAYRTFSSNEELTVSFNWFEENLNNSLINILG